MIKIAPSNTESKEVYLISDKIEDNEIIRASNLVRASSQPAQINLKEDVQNIEDIQIITFEEIMRNDKPTVLYVIVYHIKGQKFVTKRSYSEFDNLYKEVILFSCTQFDLIFRLKDLTKMRLCLLCLPRSYYRMLIISF